ncbi:hypothetical protein C9374_011512 [Naegleria lovaniensis]|uniref:Transmembrane protein n=1 Tax=Naegleria lovaniensis TaxID=51637 RepID=A0AA88H4H6_NAELO|nr:uncharacterized protein C9374_011512 [Naegleria lovaniensis]KAG2392787.1 hypothetical protein C9374_011512 [Naegleria lovaniensis]
MSQQETLHQPTSMIPFEQQQHSNFQIYPTLSSHGHYSPQIDEDCPTLNNTTVPMTSHSDTFPTPSIIQMSSGTSAESKMSWFQSLIQSMKSNIKYKTIQRVLVLLICLCVVITSIAWNFVFGVLMSLKVVLCIASGIVSFKKHSTFLNIVSVLLMLELILNVVASILLVTLYRRAFMDIVHFQEVLWPLVVVLGFMQMAIVVLNVTIARKYEKEESEHSNEATCEKRV